MSAGAGARAAELGRAAADRWGGLVAWWRDRPLRMRLVAAAAIAVTLAVGGVVGVAFVTVRHELVSHLDDQLRQQAVELQRQAAESTSGPLPRLQLHVRFGEPGGYAQVVSADGSVLPAMGQDVQLPVDAADIAVAAGRLGTQLRDATVDGADVRLLTSPLVSGLAIQVALPLQAVHDQTGGIAVAFIGLALAGVAVAVLLAWLVSRTVLAPVARLTEAAEQVAATRDLTTRIAESGHDELGRLAVTFNGMLDALAQSMAAQRQLVADASHELRTPLASLRTNAEVLRDVHRLDPAERDEVIAGIVGQLEELTALVGDVVELARGEEPADRSTELAFDRVVADAVRRARRHWPQLSFDLALTPVTVRGAPQRLHRAVANLLDNAGKFSAPGGVVEVRLYGDGRLTVRDHGRGVPPEALPHVFDRFYRADEARALPGSGLGLAIARQAVTAHGGSLGLRNAPDGGAVAQLWLPVLTGDTDPPGADESGDDAPDAHPSTPEAPAPPDASSPDATSPDATSPAVLSP